MAASDGTSYKYVVTDLHIPLQVVASGATTQTGEKSKEWRLAYVTWLVAPTLSCYQGGREGRVQGLGGRMAGYGRHGEINLDLYKKSQCFIGTSVYMACLPSGWIFLSKIMQQLRERLTPGTFMKLSSIRPNSCWSSPLGLSSPHPPTLSPPLHPLHPLHPLPT